MFCKFIMRTICLYVFLFRFDSNDVRYHSADSASDVSFEECVKLAQELKEVSRLPVSCRQYLDKKAVLHQACEGMTGDQVRQTQ